MSALYWAPRYTGPPVEPFYRNIDMMSYDADVRTLKEAGITVFSFGWYFWNVNWDISGPYTTEEECKHGVKRYLDNL